MSEGDWENEEFDDPRDEVAENSGSGLMSEDPEAVRQMSPDKARGITPREELVSPDHFSQRTSPLRRMSPTSKRGGSPIRDNSPKRSNTTDTSPMKYTGGGRSPNQGSPLKKSTTQAVKARLLRKNTTCNDEEEIVAEMKRLGQETWIDEAFPPDDYSLIVDWKHSENAKPWRKFVWFRTSEFAEGAVCVYETISPNDIYQGNLGDCYFLSALSAIAERPHRLEKLFEINKHNPRGYYIVKFCNMGIWEKYAIDDHFPCYPKESMNFGPCFSSASIEEEKTELWVLLLEKAWAKRFGSYEFIESGVVSSVLRDLTGAPTKTLFSDDPDLWEECVRGEDLDFIMAASSNSDEKSEAKIEEAGLVPGHAYAMLRAVEVETREGVARLCQLRNPWGKHEWQGDWSDDSNKWTDELRRKLSFTRADDGIFWMCFEDLCQYFDRVEICHVHDHYKYTSFECEQEIGDWNVTSMTVSKPAHGLYISFSQADTRAYKKYGLFDREYAPMRYVICRLKGDRIDYICSGIEECRDAFLKSDYEPGEYLIYTQFFWVDDQDTSFGLSSYGDSQVTFEDATREYPEFLREAFRSKAIKEGVKKIYTVRGDPNMCSYTLVSEVDGICVDHYINKSRDGKRLRVRKDYKLLENIKLVAPEDGDSYAVDLEPGEEQSVMLVAPDIDGDFGFDFNIHEKVVS